MKEKIHHPVNEKYRSQIPTLEDIRQYLHLHWTIAALKQKQIQSATQLMFPAIFSIEAWRLLLSTAILRRGGKNQIAITKIRLID